MENSVTLTLARYHDLIDIERDFDKKVEDRLSKEKTEWVKQENSIAKNFETLLHQSLHKVKGIEKRSFEILIEKESIEKQLEQSKRINFYIGGAFLISLILLISSILLQ